MCPQGTWGRLLATRVSQGRLLEASNTVIFIHFIQIVPSQLFLGFPSRTFSVADPAQRTVSETKRVAACPAREDAGSRAAQTPPGRRSPRPSPQRGPSSPRPSAVPAEGDFHRLCRQSHCFSLKATINRILFCVLFFYCFTLLRFCGPGAVSGCARPTCGSGHTSNALRVASSPRCGFQTRTAETQPRQGQARPGLGGVTRSELLAHPAATWCYLRSAWLGCGNEEKPPENTRAEF